MAWGTFTGRDGNGQPVGWAADTVPAGKAMAVQQATDADPLSYSASGGISVQTTAGGTTIAAQNLSRRRIEVSNSGTTGIWVCFGSTTPAVGLGNYLPPGAKDVYWTTSAVKGISVTSANVAGYTEW